MNGLNCVKIRKLYTMMRFVLLCTSLLFLSRSSYAVSDSVSLGVNKDKVVYYSLKNGVVSSIPNDDWHLAFSSQPALFPSNTLQSATVRINEAYGVKVYKVPNKVIADFATVDTSGWNSWNQIHDSDTLLWMGAFNRNVDLTDVYNYGWGGYNFGAHSVLGDSLFLIQMPNGTLKKFAIIKNEWDTAFVVKFSNIDNSSTNTVTIPKKPYKTKNFVYYDLNTATILDREPASSTWDIQYCVYTDANGSRKIGALINKSCSAENNWATTCNQNQKYDVRYNSMGEFGMGNDTLAEIITDQNIHIQTPNGNYNMSFGPNNPSTNTFVFTTVACANATGIEANSTLNATLFPNPTSGLIQLEVEAFSGKSIAISDIAGKTLFQQALNNNTTTIDCNTFAEGIYLLRIAGEGKSEVKRFVVVR
ncbi:MAG: T9SS type A sorting domain-containing protein [Bacteroidia bacterium]|nr:MAG: T9SS type A sorting domain-containing protein [Bacteroidia bacterium]